MRTATPSNSAARLLRALYSKVARGFLKASFERDFPQLKQQLEHKIKAKPAKVLKPVVETTRHGPFA